MGNDTQRLIDILEGKSAVRLEDEYQEGLPGCQDRTDRQVCFERAVEQAGSIPAAKMDELTLFFVNRALSLDSFRLGLIAFLRRAELDNRHLFAITPWVIYPFFGYGSDDEAAQVLAGQPVIHRLVEAWERLNPDLEIKDIQHPLLTRLAKIAALRQPA